MLTFVSTDTNICLLTVNLVIVMNITLVTAVITVVLTVNVIYII